MRGIDRDALEEELHAFEVRYNTPSDRLVDAFRVDGVLVENEDFDRWSLLWAALGPMP